MEWWYFNRDLFQNCVALIVLGIWWIKIGFGELCDAGNYKLSLDGE